MNDKNANRASHLIQINDTPGVNSSNLGKNGTKSVRGGRQSIELNSDQQSIDPDVLAALKTAESGSSMRRAKFGKLGLQTIVKLSPDHTMVHYKDTTSCFGAKFKTVKIHDILDVRHGWNTDAFQKLASKSWFNKKHQENVCFSLMLRNPEFLSKSLDLVCNSPENRRRWILALDYLMDKIKMEALHFTEEKWLKNKYEEADTNHSGSLSFNEIYTMLKDLNLEICHYHAKLLFTEANFRDKPDEKNKQVLDFDEFLLFFRQLTKRIDLLRIIRSYSKNNSVCLTVPELKNFLVDQKYPDVDVTPELCQKIIEKFEPEETNKANLIMSAQGFRLMLLSVEYGSIYDLTKTKLHQNMNHSMVDYFINSSHNTYLCGNQLQGDSSIEGYINALKHGYKLLELDVWDGADGQPIITHGMTLVTSIRLKDAARAINQYAFYVSPYPVILSLENHCGSKQQDAMATIFKDAFGDKLYRYTPPNNGENSNPDENSTFPSPEALKGKILLKSKAGKEASNHEMDPPGAIVEFEGDSFGSVVNADSTPQSERKSRVTDHLCCVLALESTKIKNLRTDVLKHPPNAFVSLQEDKHMNHEDDDMAEFLEYARRHFVKIYPSGFRTDSSNYNPAEFWVSGVQVVSLNAQTADKATDLNDGLFLMNGNCGYVLKPDLLRKSPISVLNPGENYRMILTIEIISGHYLPKPVTNPPIFDDILDPYVNIEICGLPYDRQKVRTKVIDNNGFNPLWDESFTIKLKVPELAFIRFEVNDHDIALSDDFIGEFSLPVMMLKEGYGHIRLRTGFGHEPDPTAVLFVRIKKELLA